MTTAWIAGVPGAVMFIGAAAYGGMQLLQIIRGVRSNVPTIPRPSDQTTIVADYQKMLSDERAENARLRAELAKARRSHHSPDR